jgi:hypothetical protein
MVMLDLVDAMVTASESGPEPALAKVTGALREAVDKRCSEMIRATVVDSAAGLLADLGDFPRAARLLGAGDRWCADRPRPNLEHAQAERIGAATRADLGPARCESERARGASLTAEDILRELDQARSSYTTENSYATENSHRAESR